MSMSLFHLTCTASIMKIYLESFTSSINLKKLINYLNQTYGLTNIQGTLVMKTGQRTYKLHK